MMALAVVLAYIGWLSIYRVMYTETKFSWSLPGGCFFVALALLGVYILVESSWRWIIALIAVATLPSFLMSGADWYLMAPIWILSVFIFYVGTDRIKQEQANRIKIIPHSLVKFGMPLVTTGLSLLISANFFLAIKDNSQALSVPKIHMLLPDKVISGSLHLMSSVVPQSALKSIDQGETVDEFIKNNLSHELEIQAGDVENYLRSQGRTWTVEQQQQVQNELNNFASLNEALAVVQARAELSKQLGQSLSGQEKMEDVIVVYINNRIDDFFNRQSSNGGALPLGMALALFLTLKTLAWILRHPLAWTTTGIFRIIVKMGGIEIKKEMREVEEITI